MSQGFAVDTDAVSRYIAKVEKALVLLRPSYQALVDHDPQKTATWLEDLAGKPPEHSGGPQDFHRACEAFVRESVQLYFELMEKFGYALGNLEKIVSAGNQAMAAYRQRDQEAAERLNKILRKLD
ncbi:hypothetical protein [Amycolatopsis suaedae]|uniref:PE domain-containing protein n=1 Tax=Amycolatopsis suaedae TaxID=2510978 RepID=A0A4Q7J216_9PSEU|nr:hypothetical protein [Amycolatopsis suaedae]RZQ60556.1 hypothetical protein EWH70_28180 [Amycolatopsis suaedae]